MATEHNRLRQNKQ